MVKVAEGVMDAQGLVKTVESGSAGEFK